MAEIVMTFEAGKPASVEVHGVAGDGCREATAPYEQAIGLREVTRRETEDMSLSQSEKVRAE